MAKVIAICVLGMLVSSVVKADMDSSHTLSIGDPAPKLEMLTWIKGKPIARFMPGRIYVVDFFATWCGPCIAEMPRLSALAAKYRDHVTVIGISTRERDKGSRVDLKYIGDFVKRKGDKMAYLVAADDLTTNKNYNAWAVAAGVIGLPAGFVVDQNGRIVSIGGPTDELLRALIDGTYSTEDLAAARASQAKDAERQMLLKPIYDAIIRKDWNAALKEADQRIQENRQYESTMFWSVVIARLHHDGPEALRYIREKSEDVDFVRSTGAQSTTGFMNMVASVIASQEGLEPAVYQFAVDQIRGRLANDPKGYRWWRALAEACANMKDYNCAIGAQEKVVASIEAMPADEQESNFDQLLTSMKKKLVSYRQASQL